MTNLVSVLNRDITLPTKVCPIKAMVFPVVMYGCKSWTINKAEGRSWSGRSPGERTGNPLQYSCLGNPMDRGAWQARVHGIAKSWTRLSTHTHMSVIM